MESPFVTTTRKGNVAITPEGLRNLKVTRQDQPLVESNFVTARENITEHYDRYGMPEEDYEDPIFPNLYETIVPKDVNTNTYEVIVFRDPRAKTLGQESEHLYDLNIPVGSKAAELMGSPYSYHVRFDTVSRRNFLKRYRVVSSIDNALPLRPERLRVFEMQTDLMDTRTVNDIGAALYDTSKWQRYAASKDNPDAPESIDDVYDLFLAFGLTKKQIKFSKQESKKITKKLEELADQVRQSDNSPQASDDFIQSELNQEITNFLSPTFTSLHKTPLPDIDVSQNIINRMIAEAKDREINEVSFLIGKDTPESKKYMGIQGSYYDPKDRGYLQRSVEVQKNYETTITGQVIATAKKIGGTHSWDKVGYLTITLPEKEFTLPMFKNQGGKVIRSLQRTRKLRSI
jgi:hypothetical protein